MSSTMWVGTTGLTASEQMMNVIGNNLANANTIGYKAGDISFASMLSQNLSGGSGKDGMGQGVSVSAISTNFTQGTLQSTNNATDVAIDGNGFFIMKDKEGLPLYTRAGGFHINNVGLLADINNYTTQGHMFDTDGVVESKALTDLNLRNVQSKPRATTYFNVGLTLDSQTAPGDTFNTSQVVYDSRGAAHTLNTVFQKTGDPAYWSVKMSLDGSSDISQSHYGISFDSTGALSGVYKGDIETPTITSAGGGTAEMAILNPGQLYKSTTVATGPLLLTRDSSQASGWAITGNGGYTNAALNLDTTGASPLVGVDLDGAGGSDITFTLSGGWANNDTIQFGITAAAVAPANVDIAFAPTMPDGSTIGADGVLKWDLVGTSAPKISTFATTSRIASQFSDGYAPGILSSLTIDKDGIVEGKFSNGQTQKLARLLLADFPDIKGLKKIGSYFTETAESGAAVNNKPGSGGLGSVQSSSLEVSNTDVATEFVKMITAQRAYQSNAKIITSADQMLQELMNIKQ